jgi:hypothetical protein
MFKGLTSVLIPCQKLQQGRYVEDPPLRSWYLRDMMKVLEKAAMTLKRAKEKEVHPD